MAEADQLSDDNYAPYPTKRARQACENCRRKKARCPGEKPKCSLCVRLRQRCVYASRNRRLREREDEGGHNITVPDQDDHSQRLSVIESKLDQLTAAIGSSTSTFSSHPPSTWPPVNISNASGLPISPVFSGDTSLRRDGSLHNEVQTPASQTWLQIRPDLNIPTEVVQEGIHLYFEHFHEQPYPLLSEFSNYASASFDVIPFTILYPMLSLSLRVSKHLYFDDRKKMGEVLDSLSEAAWNISARTYANFEFDFAYFQGLCLLAQVDFASGRPERAQAQVALGLRLAQSRGMLLQEEVQNFNSPDSRIRREIVWSLFLMDRIFRGRNVPRPSAPASCYKLFLYDGGPLPPDQLVECYGRFTLHDSLQSRLKNKPISIVSVSVEILRIWEDVISDLFHTTSEDEVDFWKEKSLRSRIDSDLLELEMKLHEHRYASVGSAKRVIQEPHLKPYFRIWLIFQILYSAIHCCLHHPFIIFMKTRQIQGRVPLTFLQKSYENSMIHSKWVIRLITEMAEAGLLLHEPFIGHVAAIAATIHLEHTLSKHPRVARIAKRHFEKGRDFVKLLSLEWPNMLNTLKVLDELSIRLNRRQTISYVQDEYDGALPSNEIEDVAVDQEDVDLMWKVFDYASLSKEKTSGWPVSSNPPPDASQPQSSSNVQDIPRSSNLNEMDSQDAALPTGENLNTLIDFFPSQMIDFDFNQAFIDDWTLFGRPWSAYFPQEPQ